jgi:peptidoglycan/LPS O-acetylase OafA/YrhL
MLAVSRAAVVLAAIALPLSSRVQQERSSPRSEERNSAPKYRSDIDGLRALSILAVVAYHVFPEWIPGGFVGVDVFFVISGFLISTIIFKSLAKDNFSFVEFYAHRVCRIFPALIVVMAFCLVLGWDVLLPSEFEYLGKHIAASAGFVQNIVLSRESGYFDIGSALKPLNHLWSLAIEEQFYAVFPLLMWGAWRLAGLGSLRVVAAICAISLAASIHYAATGSFFSLTTRAWELMAGALLAGAMLDSVADGPLKFAAARDIAVNPGFFVNLPMRSHGRLPSRQGLVQSVLSVIGFALILYAAFAFDGQMPYPGWRALLPVLGGLLLILSGSAACINRFVLSNRAAVFIGLISYPLYLWHWPLLSYLTIVDNALPPLYQRSAAAILSIILAWLTYRLIERPIRQYKKIRQRAVKCLVGGMVLLLTVGLCAKHLYRDYDPQTKKIIQSWNFQGYSKTEGLIIDKKYNIPAIGQNENNRILFYGDSHLEQYRNTVAKLLKTQNAPRALFPPFTDFPPSFASGSLNDRTISAVVFSYFWALQYRSGNVNTAVRCCGKGLNGIIGLRRKVYTAQQMDELDHRWEGIARTWIEAGKQVYFVLDNPFGEELAPQSLVRRSLFHGIQVAIVPFSKQQAIKRDEPVRSRLLQIARNTGAKVIDPFEDLCGENLCPALFVDGMPIYKDYDHLSDNAVINHVHYLDVLVTPEAAHSSAVAKK